MAKRHGAVLVFKEGVTPSKAASALKKIADVLDLPKESFRTVEVGRNRTRTGVRKNNSYPEYHRPCASFLPGRGT